MLKQFRTDGSINSTEIEKFCGLYETMKLTGKLEVIAQLSTSLSEASGLFVCLFRSFLDDSQGF